MDQSSALSEISTTTLSLSGILVDIYGLDQLGRMGTVTCLWLLHPRTYSRQHMKEFAHLSVSSWLNQSQEDKNGRGLLALAFDLPNHGSRLIDEMGNREFDEGNDQHAINMVNTVKNGRTELSKLITELEEILEKGKVENHIALGWSLGGHVVWQSWLWEQRINAAVVVIGCPDILGLLKHRLKTSNIKLVGPFKGSKYFPNNIVDACTQSDPKSYLFGKQKASKVTLSANDECRLWTVLNHTIKGKKLLLCSGDKDDLVPYTFTEPFMKLLLTAIDQQNWQGKDAVDIDDRLYMGVGHSFSPDMVQDAIDWIMKTMRAGMWTGQRGISTRPVGPFL